MHSVWDRLPVIVRAVLTGATLATIGTVPWALLGEANLKYLPSVPWSAPLTLAYLWFYWRYLKGEGWPRSTAEARRRNLRANPVTEDAWGLAFVAGMVGLVLIVVVLRVMSRMVRIPQIQPPDLSHASWITLFFILLVGSIVSGVVEEASFRGYMQGPIERRHGFFVAVLVSGAMFGLAHLTHPEVGLSLLPYYVTVSAVYGGLAYLTNSIKPSMMLHAGGNFFGGIGVLAGGGDWSSVAAPPAPLIWQTGADSSFWASVIAMLAIATLTVGAYMALANAVRKPASVVQAASITS